MAAYKLHLSTNMLHVCIESFGSRSKVMQVRVSINCCHRRARRQSPPADPEPVPEGWDVISLPTDSESGADSEKEEEVAIRQPTAAEKGQGDFRCYCVWGFSAGGCDWKGVHCGPGRSAYDGIVRLNSGSIGGLRFKRLDSLQASKELYITKMEKTLKHFLREGLQNLSLPTTPGNAGSR